MKTLVLLHSLGADGSLWDPQRAALGARYRLVVPEVRTPPASIAAIGAAVLAQLDGRAHFMGLSMGGQVALWLALHAADRVDKIVLACTAAQIGTPAGWDERIALVRAGGVAPLAADAAAALRWFTPGYLARAPEALAAARARLRATPPEVYAGCCAAIRDFDARADLGAVRAPTLVVVGRHDPSTPPADGRFMAERIPGARLVELDAAHLANVEAAAAFNAAVLDFLGDQDG
jgi:3-oxoadipate enol-lactonase